jgi:hypothetical protein
MKMIPKEFNEYNDSSESPEFRLPESRGKAEPIYFQGVCSADRGAPGALLQYFCPAKRISAAPPYAGFAIVLLASSGIAQCNKILFFTFIRNHERIRLIISMMA